MAQTKILQVNPRKHRFIIGRDGFALHSIAKHLSARGSFAASAGNSLFQGRKEYDRNQQD